jgi:hypothetical protein
MARKQPIIFDESQSGNSIYEAQMMDLLVHYAESGVSEAERVMADEPDFFTDAEKKDIKSSKVVLDRAPEILEEYMRKVRELEALHEEIHKVVSKCEQIVGDFEERKAYGDKNKKIKKSPSLNPGMIRYTEDGEMIVEKSKKVLIELPKSHK